MDSDRRTLIENLDRTFPTAKPYSARRDTAARKLLRTRILSEFNEMPGMSLTAAQASRLFGLPHETCSRILDELAGAGLLHRRVSGCFGLPPGAFNRRAG
jgi:hypothetical protein